jgi:hypothetical protein
MVVTQIWGDWGLRSVVITTRRVWVVQRSSFENERGRPGEQLGHARTRLGPGNEDTLVIEADTSCFDITVSTTAMGSGWEWGGIEGWGRQMLSCHLDTMNMILSQLSGGVQDRFTSELTNDALLCSRPFSKPQGVSMSETSLTCQGSSGEVWLGVLLGNVCIQDVL